MYILPMIKKNNSSSETLMPKISFRVNPGNNMKNHSTSNKLLDPNNIFEMNRLGLSDSFEAGKSLTFGTDYKFDIIENIIHDVNCELANGNNCNV